MKSSMGRPNGSQARGSRFSKHCKLCFLPIPARNNLKMRLFLSKLADIGKKMAFLYFLKCEKLKLLDRRTEVQKVLYAIVADVSQV